MSIYSFVDTTEAGGQPGLPAEAMSFNGVYLENQIEGYRTLYVEGREALSADVDMTEIASRDGAKYNRRHYAPRYLTVGFQLRADTPEDFTEAVNSLLFCLTAEQAQIIFHDEPDKYYVGTKTKITSLPPGRLSATGEIEIKCADPFKYSVAEKTATAATVSGQKVFSVNYQGTYKAHPIIEATCGSDNGFYGFAHENGAVLQIGAPEEVDTEDVQKSEMLINDSFESGTPTGWQVNQGRTSTPAANAMTGSWQTCTSTSKGNGICASSYGTGTSWHGPALSKTIPADSHGQTGAQNFKAAWMWEAFTYLKTELVNAQFNVVGEKNGVKYVLAGIELMDGTPNGNATTWRLWANGEIIQSGSTTTRHDNPWAGVDCGEPSIQKSGKEIIYKIAGQTYSFKNDDYEDLEATEITIYVSGHASAATTNHAAFFYVHFRKDAIADTEDIPNSLMPNDKVEIDTGAGTINVNGAPTPGLGAIGNQWEGFVLKPGANTIVCAASTWVNDDTYTMRYKEVYL